MCLIESKLLLVLGEHSCDTRLAWAKHEVVTLTIFMNIYSRMPFNAFNGSLIEQGLILVAGFKLVIHSLIQEKGKEKSPKWCQMVVTGLTGDRHRSDRCHRSKCIWMGDPARVPGWPGTPLYAAGWPDSYDLVTRGCPNPQKEGWFGVEGYEKLNTFQLINHSCVVTKFGMSLTEFLIEQSALFEKFKISSTT
jgi:hypothetical protein